jgi:Flp pilus assembly protein TadD
MDHAEALRRLQIGLSHHQAQRVAEAERIYREVLAAVPNQPDALHLLGVLCAQLGRPAEGLPLLQRAVTVAPQVAEFHRHLGETLEMLGRSNEALAAFSRALQFDPNDVQSRNSAGAVLLARGQAEQAAEQFRIVTQMVPNDAGALGNYGHVLSKLGRVNEALEVFKRALQIAPNNGPVLMQYAEAIWRTGNYTDAVTPARRAAQILPDDPRALIMYGNTLQTAGELEEAEQVYRRAATLDDSSFDAHSNLALTVLKQGDAATALTLYDRILARWPSNTDARANRSLALLTLGDFERGFAEYEARWASAAFANQQRPGALWDGRDVRGKTVLLTSEQGHGDTIQFVRYATLIADRGANVIVSCPADLKNVVASVRGVSRVIVAKQETAAFDFYAPLASLPRLFKTTQATVPAEVAYMHADAALVQRWREQLGGDAAVKVGIVWAGSPQHQNDRVRSATFAHFAPLADVAGVKLYSLQKGPAAKDADERVVSLGDALTDYAQTAAVLENLDLVIAVDTSVVHLVGALGRPVWTLLAKGPDWRWMLEREDSPWYPTMRLFRQTRLHDWETVTQRVAGELKQFVATRNPSPA